MILNTGDFVTSIRAFDAWNAKWAIWIIKRLDSPNWEVALTWDSKLFSNNVAYKTLYHRFSIDGSESIFSVESRVEALIQELEYQKKARCIALIAINSCDPAAIIDRIYGFAKQDIRLNFSIIRYDSPPFKKF